MYNYLKMEDKDLEGMMQGMFWKDILYDIVKNMNPWDVDITHLASRYTQRVDEMKEMDFKISANVVIVSSVLLRMKADMVARVNFNPDDYRDGSGGDELELVSPDFDPNIFVDSSPEMRDELMDWGSVAIAVKPRRVPKRRVSVFELVSAIQDVLEDNRVKGRKSKSRSGGRVLEINIDRDMQEVIEETYIRVMERLSNGDMVPFSEIVRDKGELISTLISLLHLSNKQRVRLRQDKLFDEIFIKAA